MLPCGNPHLSNQANQMLTYVIILANLSAPIKHCHVSISSISHETLISTTMTATPRQPPLTPTTIFLAHRLRHHDVSTALATHSPATIARCRRRTRRGSSYILVGHHLYSRPRVLLPRAPAMAAAAVPAAPRRTPRIQQQLRRPPSQFHLRSAQSPRATLEARTSTTSSPAPARLHLQSPRATMEARTSARRESAPEAWIHHHPCAPTAIAEDSTASANEPDRKPASVHSRTSTRSSGRDSRSTIAPSLEPPPPQRSQTMTAATSLHETLTQKPREEGGVNPNSGKTLYATCQPLIAQSN